MQQEDGVIHRDTQLQDQSQCLGDIGYLSQKDVGSEVVDDWENDSQNEDKRCYGGLQPHKQYNHTQDDGSYGIQRSFLVHQILGILSDGGKAAQIAFTIGIALDGFNGIHRTLG